MNIKTTISGDKELDDNIWWLLQKLKKLSLITEKNQEMLFPDFSDDPTAPRQSDLGTAFGYLIKQKVITTRFRSLPIYRAVVHPQPNDSHNPEVYKDFLFFTVSEPKFKAVYADFNKRYRNTLPLPKKNIEKSHSQITQLTFIDQGDTERKVRIVVNNLNDVEIAFDTKKSTGSLLLKIQQGDGNIQYSEHKKSYHYVNSGNSALNTKTGYAKTDILKSSAGYIEPNVKIKRISQRQLKDVVRKQSKKP